MFPNHGVQLDQRRLQHHLATSETTHLHPGITYRQRGQRAIETPNSAPPACRHTQHAQPGPRILRSPSTWSKYWIQPFGREGQPRFIQPKTFTRLAP